VSRWVSGDGFRDDLFVDGVSAYSNSVRVGYARVSGRSQDHQLQLDALANAGCREVIAETTSTRGERPKLRAALDALKPGDTLVIYKPDRVARSMKELPLLAGDLAAAATDELAPAVVRTWLVNKGWQVSPELLCSDHPHPLHEPGPGTGSGYSSSSGPPGPPGHAAAGGRHSQCR
jgi:hypothetical protein